MRPDSSCMAPGGPVPTHFQWLRVAWGMETALAHVKPSSSLHVCKTSALLRQKGNKMRPESFSCTGAALPIVFHSFVTLLEFEYTTPKALQLLPLSMLLLNTRSVPAQSQQLLMRASARAIIAPDRETSKYGILMQLYPLSPMEKTSEADGGGSLDAEASRATKAIQAAARSGGGKNHIR
jgi:hypothetical protein